MRSKLLFPLIALLILFTSGIVSAQAPPQISAQSAILVDGVTGKVLYEKHCHTKMPIASTTKMMTTILVLEHGDLKSIVHASDNACKTPFGALHLKPGETMTLKDLMYGMLLRSSNDAAVCAAEHIAGTEPKFVQMMNEKAKALGAKDTHFVNPHGLYDPMHYSTAYDLSLIARYGIRKPEFNQFVKTKTYHVERSIDEKDVFVKNTARFLWKFSGADGIKTGYTKEAGRCFVGSATRDNWRLVSVVLHAVDAGADTAALMDYGFANYKPVVFAKRHCRVRTVDVKGGGVKKQVDLDAATDLARVLPKDAPANMRTEIKLKRVSAPFQRGKKFGTLTGYLNGKEVGTVDLIAAETVKRTFGATVWFVFRTILLIILTLVLGLIVYGTATSKNTRRRRRGITPRSGKNNHQRPGGGRR